MKILRSITAVMLVTVLLLNLTSCLVVHQPKDNGKHKGWYKNNGNPHSPFSKSPAKTAGKAHGKHKK